MTIMAVVPMRGGSKGIPLKNIQLIHGKPLCYYVLEELLKTPEIDQVVVSTEDIAIKSIVKCLSEKILVIDRPYELATDNITSEAVLEHVIDTMGDSYDQTLFAQCTSPLTESEDFSMLIKASENKNSAAFYTDCYSYFFDDDYNQLIKPRLPRQVRTPRKKEAGNGWIFNTKEFKIHKTRLFGDIGLVNISFIKSLEIDEPEDLILMNHFLGMREI